MLLTIITPTYNRAYTLSKCYESLCCQNNKDFMWLIVDDGSTDNTCDIVKKWITDDKIKIKYIKKENGGKASALNIGIDVIETEYSVCLDSDDWFYDNAVETAIRELEAVKDDRKCCGLLALRNNSDGSVKGKRSIPKEMKTVTAADVFLKLGLRTEVICFYKTYILRKYRFPVFPGEKFVSPSWMQYTITKDYYFKTSWSKFCVCEYIPDGLTRNKRKVILNNPNGYTCIKLLCFNNATTIKQKVMNGIMYDCGCILGKDRNWLKNTKHKMLAIVLMPAAIYVKHKRFDNNNTSDTI